MTKLASTVHQNLQAQDLRARYGGDSGFFLWFFTGVQPATSAALNGALASPLIRFEAYTADGGGLLSMKWADVASGATFLERDQSQAVRGVAATAGTATWAMLGRYDDDPTVATTTKPRECYSVGTLASADLQLNDVTFASGEIVPFTGPLRLHCINPGPAPA